MSNPASSDTNKYNLRIFSHLNGFVICRARPYVVMGDVYISSTEHNRKLTFTRWECM